MLGWSSEEDKGRLSGLDDGSPHPIPTYRKIPRGPMAWHPQKNIFFTAQSWENSEGWLADWLDEWMNKWVGGFWFHHTASLTCVVISLPLAIYLCKRTMQNKARLELADYEAVSMIISRYSVGGECKLPAALTQLAFPSFSSPHSFRQWRGSLFYFPFFVLSSSYHHNIIISLYKGLSNLSNAKKQLSLKIGKGLE